MSAANAACHLSVTSVLASVVLSEKERSTGAFGNPFGSEMLSGLARNRNNTAAVIVIPKMTKRISGSHSRPSRENSAEVDAGMLRGVGCSNRLRHFSAETGRSRGSILRPAGSDADGSREKRTGFFRARLTLNSFFLERKKKLS